MAAEAEASREARAKVNKSKFLNETCQQIVESQWVIDQLYLCYSCV